VPEVLVKQLIELGEEANIGGQESELTIFFSDITDFTSIAERMHPQALMLHLSEYLEELSTIIVSEDGTIDKYIGDAIMAFWGAPLQQQNAPYLACRSALICQQRNHKLNLKWRSERKPELKTRIGLHTGQTIVGNVGSSVRINYSVIGDSVNLAARLESINKIYGTEIIISEDTYLLVKDNFKCRLLDIVAVKGKQKGAQIYELLHESNQERPHHLKSVDFYEQYENALGLYLAQNWLAAREQFQLIIKIYDTDLSVTLMIQRCTKFIDTEHNFPNDWDGVTQLDIK
jgi:adenylate cyclase